MAPASKRRRTLEDDESSVSSDNGEEEMLDIETARSHVRLSNGKRSRTALASENGGSVVSDESSDNEEDQGRSRQEDGANSDEEDRREDAIMHKIGRSGEYREWLTSDKDNIPAEYGVIEEVYCQNFMCHTKLRIKLGPLINFIIGHNGSGKSAVLTALTLCLGVKATATNRGASLKNFIKEGQESAMLSVKIKNQGELAYQHDIYGDSIYVERHFNKAGASNFKIKNADERLITTKKSDLEDMLDYLGLQLDNPLNVLSQDLARQFLSNSTPHDKYKFFLKGTQLEQLDRDYRLMYDLVDQTEAKTYQRKADVDVLKQRYEAAAAKKKLMDEAGTLRDRINHMTWMHAWAQVEDVEREIIAADEAIAKAEQTIRDRERDAATKSEEYNSKNGSAEAARQVKQDLENELRPKIEERELVNEEFQAGKKTLQENQTQMRHIKSDLESAIADVKKREADIKAEQDRIELASGPAQAQKLAELREAEDVAEEKKAALGQSDKRALEQARTAAEDKLNAARNAEGPAQEQKDSAERRLADLQRSEGDQMKGFNNNMPRLLRAIATETRFRQKPVGPMGMHVKLKKPEWSSTVESVFGLALEAFVVTNGHDQGILRGIQQRIGCVSDIYIGDPRPIDVSNNRPDGSQETLLDILDIDSDLVRNQLIINQAIEQLVLIKKRQEGHDFMYNGERPRNTKSVMCMHDTTRGEGHRFAYTGSGGQRMDRVRPWTKAARMKTDLDAQIRNQREIVDDAIRKLDLARKSTREEETKVKHAKEAITRYDREQRNLRTASQQADDRVEELKAELEGFTIDAGKLQGLKDALKDAETAKSLHANSYTDAAEAKDRIDDAQKVLKTRYDRAKARVEEDEARIAKVEASLVKHETARTAALREKNLAYGFLETAKEEKEKAEADREEVGDKLKDFTENAEQVHARVPVQEGLTAESIDKKLEKLMKEQETAERRIGGTREEIVAAYIKAKEEWRTADNELKTITELSNVLKRAYFNRNKRWIGFRRWITARAKFTFSMLLNERNFKGNLQTDHKNKAMDIQVEPDITVTSDRGRQAKTLSGGEKSFSTICLLLSIWEAMGSPIRCLDEFDVFMDNVNRDTSMRMMIQAARRATGKQYILITPQSMGNVPIDPDIRVHKMTDPERGQTALAFS